MIWESAMLEFSTMLGCDVESAAIIMATFMTIGVILAILAVGKKKSKTDEVIIGSLFCVVLFTALGWYTAWVGGVLALGLALVGAYVITGGKK